MKKTQAFPHISDYKIVLATENEISTIRHLVNAAYQQLAEMGLNYTATFQDEEKTLTDEVVEKMMTKITQALHKNLQAEVRN